MRLRKLIAPLAAALALAGVGASPVLAGNNTQDSVAYGWAKYECQQIFPNTCFGVTKLSEGLCTSSYCNYYYRYYGYYGSRRVRCDATIWVTTNFGVGTSARNCVYA